MRSSAVSSSCSFDVNSISLELREILTGIDRNSVSFGAWSGLVELRGVALRAEALSVLFETLGMDLPVTVEAGFIGLLRVVVPWKTIGSSPVKIELEGVNIIARPVRDDGSDDSEIKLRERRIKRAKLNTDDAVREAAWSVGNSETTKKGYRSWLVSDDLLAKVVANIQIELRDLILRFEDPFSNSEKPYAVALHCDTLKAVSANESWEQVFVENVSAPRTYKLLIVEGFRMDWLPLKATDLQRYSNPETSTDGNFTATYSTHEKLQDFFTTADDAGDDSAVQVADSPSRKASNLIHPVNGSLRLSLTRGEAAVQDSLDSDIEDIPADALVDIHFPDISLQMDEVQYSSLVQTSLHFSRLSIRGYTPKTPKERWIWAVEQLLPGFRDRRARLLAFTNEGILEKREERLLYISSRIAVMCARRTNVAQPADVSGVLESLETSIPFVRQVIYRDLADEQFEKEFAETPEISSPKAQPTPSGTTMSYFWSRLGYKTEEATPDEANATEDATQSGEALSSEEAPPADEAQLSDQEPPKATRMNSTASETKDELRKKLSMTPTVQVSFHLYRGSIRLSEGGYPSPRNSRVDLVLSDLIIGAKKYPSHGFLVEVLLGTVEALDVKNDRRIVYGRVPRSSSSISPVEISATESLYPIGVTDAISSIRSGFETTSDEVAESEPLYSREDDASKGHHMRNQSSDLAAWAAAATTSSTHATHRVTDAEFFGAGRDDHNDSLPYIAAFQIYRKSTEQLGSKKRNQTHFVAAVGQLEAVVDGPKGLFLWASRFWSPKGLKRDPIMAFLGAAAGARIAALRMELEEALLADRLPVQVDALIRAPRFIVPGKTPSSPAVVVNMGTLGIRTSEDSEDYGSATNPENKLGRYSNYALSLDDLGMYIAPTEDFATSAARNVPKKDGANCTDFVLVGDVDHAPAETKTIERLIRPLSLRLFAQVLRDPSTVQVGRRMSQELPDDSNRISKLRLRGQIPGLWLVLSQNACKHLLSSAKHWNALAVSAAEEENAEAGDSSSVYPGTLEHKSPNSSEAHPSIATLPSYDCRIGVDHISLELRDAKDQRLITAVASGMYATLVKTKLKSLESAFTLNSWTVTDGSRGSTAPFRRLAYAGTGSELRGVSPPRSSASSRHSRTKSQSQSDLTGGDQNFVTIKHTLHLPGREQAIKVHFLSLNLIFVRETVLKLTSFFEALRDSDAPVIDEETAPTDDVSASLEDDNEAVPGNVRSASLADSQSGAPSNLTTISGGAVFDGFRIQFVSGEGAICSIEMRDFEMRSRRDEHGDIKASGDVRYFAIDDLTASVREHRSFVRYERRHDAVQRLQSTTDSDDGDSPNENRSDGWSLAMPRRDGSDIMFQTFLQDLQVVYLARFTSVMSHYFSSLVAELRKSKYLAELEAASLMDAHAPPPSELSGSRSRQVLFEMDSRNVSIVVPRHSGNPNEALVLALPKIHLDNTDVPAAGYNSRLRISFSDMQMSVQYEVPRKGSTPFRYVSPMGSKSAAELELDIGDFAEYRKSLASSRVISSPFIRSQFRFTEMFSLHLCEAQYSVLYFVLTENLIETIDKTSMALETGSITAADEAPVPELEGRFESDNSSFHNVAPIAPTTEGGTVRKTPFIRLLLELPMFSMTVSRGWNVSDVDCQLLEAKIADISGTFEYSESEILAELNASIRMFTDLRPEHSIGSRLFAYPFNTGKTGGNCSFTYSKNKGHRPTIGVTISDVEVKVVPDLFRDLSYLAIPGWPFLSTSQFAPPVEYLGRILSVSLENSQLLLCADESDGDGRGIIFSGQIVTRVEWMRKTGAKSVSLQTSGLQVAFERQLEQAAWLSPAEDYVASRHFDRDALIVYPSDSVVHYCGPGIDDKGARVNIEADSILCRINVKDIPALGAVLRRFGRSGKSYLSNRNWRQPGIEEQKLAVDGFLTPEATQKNPNRQATNVSLTYSSPAARVLLTDESEGRFVPILEMNFESILMEGTVPDLVQVGTQVSVNLFSRKKGWWEPGVEPWQTLASFSRGQSGTVSFVLKSEDRLNLNVTPDTIQGAKEVLSSLHSVKKKADEDRLMSNGENQKAKEEEKRDQTAPTNTAEPSVAAFHVRNELGVQVEMFVPASSQRSTLLRDKEQEVHVPVERLLPPNRSTVRGNENNWRYEVLKCNLSLSGFATLELSAAEVGTHEVTFVPLDFTDPDETALSTDNGPISAVWEISMVHGVPICTIRSLLRVVNETSTVLELSLCAAVPSASQSFGFSAPEDEGAVTVLQPGDHYAIPVTGLERPFKARPYFEHVDSKADANVQAEFGWSRAVNGWEWLKAGQRIQASRQKQPPAPQGKGGRSRTPRAAPSSKRTGVRPAGPDEIEHEVVRCECLRTGPDFFVAAVPELFNRTTSGTEKCASRLDIVLQAPLTFWNKLPGSVSYRISEAQASDGAWGSGSPNVTILGAGVIDSSGFAHIHCTNDTQNLSGMSVAFENAPMNHPGESLRRITDSDSIMPVTFGPFVPLSSIVSGQTKAMQGSSLSKPELGDSFHISALDSRVPKFEFSVPFWFRNRSDTHLDVCSRTSFYGKPSTVVRSNGYPRGEPAGRFLCFEGPYLSLRGGQNTGQKADHEWWTSPSDLRDIGKPVPLTIPGKNLLLDVRQTRGVNIDSFAVTVRNAAFVVNNSNRCIQWCQTSVLDAHGNCPFRFVHVLNPQNEAPIHWNGSASQQSIHIRLAEEDGSSDWIWSPALPLLLGNAGEVSAKMYRPKSQEQYIARVLSSKLDGGAAVLMVLSEDRQNPPYRIVNNCSNRSIAFHQLGSHERPWLVRPGRATRYSWDDPLATVHRRKLEVDVIEDHSGAGGASSSSRTAARVSSPDAGSAPGGSSSAAPPVGTKASSSRVSSQPLQLNIDIVNASPARVDDQSDLDLWYTVSMEGATKVLTFLDSSEDPSTLVDDQVQRSVDPLEEADPVPVVLWDDLHLGSGSFSEQGSMSGLSSKHSGDYATPQTSDYPQKRSSSSKSVKKGKSFAVDAAFYLASAGVSVVNTEPVEIVYAHVTDLHMNFESYDSLECFSFQVRDFQVDNQLENPPYPVMLWAAPNAMPHQVQVELQRVMNDSGILMLKSVKVAARPFNLMVDEDLIGRFIMFFTEIVAASYGPEAEVLYGKDGEHEKILLQMEQRGKIIRTIKKKVRSAKGKEPRSDSSRRIYVEDLKLFSTKIILSSSVSRGSLSSRRMSLSPALRPFMAFLMNVENCEFEFSSLELRHLFDSKTHFYSLIRQYYESQLSNQKMKLLTSNSLVGNPAALFDSVAMGAKDLLSEPGRGRSGGEILFGVGRGSKSLITHTVGGIVGSISSIPQAVSTGLESAVGDETYVAERERIRGTQLSGGRRVGTSNPAQGAVSGFLSFAHGISSGVAGLVKDPVQGAMQGGATGFLKGVRKGIVGGVVKPVAGAIDLIAEPAASISKQMNEADAQRRRGGEIFAPQRPPRTFWGDSKRLVAFDMKTATGEELYKAVQITSGVSHGARLVDWVELSDRKGRTDQNASEWVWRVVRQRTRAMGKAKKGSRFGEGSSSQGSQDLQSQLRPEKIRIALLTEENILIATLECKLLLTIPLWKGASFSLESNAKDLFVRTRMGATSSREDVSSIIAGTQSLFAAPWDASSATRRRKPSPGEVTQDRIPCGSVSAREDLSLAVLKLIESVRSGQPVHNGRSFISQSPADIELSVLPSAIEDENATELTQTRRSDAADGAAGVFILPMRGPGGDMPANAGRMPTSDPSTPVVERKSRSQLENSITRLAMGGTQRAIDSMRSIRIIVANELDTPSPLVLVRSSLEKGFWRVAVPQQVDAFSAVLFEVDSGSQEEIARASQRNLKEVHGSVLFRLMGPGDQMVGNSPQALLEFVNPAAGSPSYSTRTSGGLCASYERGSGTHATVIFRIGHAAAKASETRAGASANAPIVSSRALPGGSGGVARRLTSSSLFGSAMRLASAVQETRGRGSGRSMPMERPPATAPPTRPMPVVDDRGLAQLLELGFEAGKAREALRRANGDIVRAVDILTG